jgi:hypothetical protein
MSAESKLAPSMPTVARSTLSSSGGGKQRRPTSGARRLSSRLTRPGLQDLYGDGSGLLRGAPQGTARHGGCRPSAVLCRRLRDLADHGHHEKLAAKDVEECIAGIQWVLADVL